MRNAPRIYNLFPRLLGPMDRWVEWCRHAASLLFDWVYINPFHYPGFSGSLYAIKDYQKLNPLFLPEARPAGEDDLGSLRAFVGAARDTGVRLMMDLVINHTAKDSELVRARPDWFLRDPDGGVKSPSAIDPADARRVTVWGDLGEVDNHGSSDRENLWRFWERLVEDYARLGFEGFRCDAAYQIPAALWSRVIAAARRVNPDCLFFAETLGCRLEDIVALQGAGFDCIASSSKWWNFSDAWCLEQHSQFRSLAPSVSFPETHDTARLAAETGGLAPVQVQRYAFAAMFSAGILMPIGYEYGFRRKLDVVRTSPADMEEPSFDIRPAVREINVLKQTFPILSSEGLVEALWGLDGPVLCLRKSWGDERLLAVINKDWREPRHVAIGAIAALLGGGPVAQIWPRGGRVEGLWERTLGPAEVVMFRAGSAPVSAPAAD